MEALKARDALKAVYLKHKARSDKWKALPTDPRVEDIPKMEQDMKNEEEFGKALQVVTKVILGHQLPHSWHEKVTSYSLAIQDFSKDYLDKAEAVSYLASVVLSSLTSRAHHLPESSSRPRLLPSASSRAALLKSKSLGALL